ncbi:MAG: hypothetical protein V5A33_05255, partial [Halobacteriales archaeon]
MDRRALAVGSLALVLLVAGCSAPLTGGSTSTAEPTSPSTTSATPTTPVRTAETPSTDEPTSNPTPTPAPTTDTTTDQPEDPSSVRENGVRYDESLPITPSDGFNRTEIELVRDRAMARIEVIRGHEFTENVSVEIRSRAEYRNSSTFSFPENRWRD